MRTRVVFASFHPLDLMRIQPPKDEKWFLTADVLIDGTGRGPLFNPVVVVENERIIEVASSQCLLIPTGSYRVELRGATLLPGLIDCHFHAVGDPFFQSGNWARQPREALLQQANNSLRLALKKGVTSIRDCGSPRRVMAEAYSAIEERIMPGPHIITCNQAIDANPKRGNGIGLGKPSSIKKAVEMTVDGGADFIKVLLSGGDYLTGGAADRQVDPEMLHVLVKIAHSFGKKVSAQTYSLAAVEAALAANVDTLEVAALGLDLTVPQGEEIGTNLTRSSVSIIPTIEHVYSLQGLREGWSVHRNGEDSLHSRNVRRLFDHGASIGAGSNRINCDLDNYSLTPEINYLAQALESNMAALCSATSVAAKIAGIQDGYGSINPGKRADILAVQGNLLHDLSNLDQVLLVLKDGLVVEDKTTHEKEV